MNVETTRPSKEIKADATTIANLKQKGINGAVVTLQGKFVQAFRSFKKAKIAAVEMGYQKFAVVEDSYDEEVRVRTVYVPAIEAAKVRKAKDAKRASMFKPRDLENLKDRDVNFSSLKIAPIEWVSELHKLPVSYYCGTCGGNGYVHKGQIAAKKKGEYFVPPHSVTPEACPTCDSSEYDRRPNYLDRRDTSKGYAGRGVVIKKEWKRVTVGYPKFEKDSDRWQIRGGDCDLCGKIIPSWRFVPVMGRQDNSTPFHLFVGEDCAKKFFGITIKELKKKNGRFGDERTHYLKEELRDSKKKAD